MAVAGKRAGIVSITVRVRTRDGRQRDLKIDPKKYDSLFLNAEAAENLLVPYYTARYGFKTADKRLARLRRAAEQPHRTTLVLHMPHTIYLLHTL